MSETVGKIISYIVLAIIMIGCITMMLGKMDDSVDAYVRDEAVKFVDECRTTGRVSSTNFEVFCHRIYSLGDYEISLSHGKKSAHTYLENGRTKMETSYSYVNETEIMDIMYPDDPTTEEFRDYLMSNGDTLSITVKRNSSSLGDAIMFFSGYGASNTSTMIQYSGPVGYTAK